MTIAEEAAQPVAAAADTTVRTYTARLSGLDADAAFAHHVATNLGKRVFGDVLLTLRAAVSPEVVQSDHRRFQNATLFAWWFPVEDVRWYGADGSLGEFPGVVSNDPRADFAAELAAAGVSAADIEVALGDAAPLFSVELRPGARFVNRRAMWRQLVADHPEFETEDAFVDMAERLLDVAGSFTPPAGLTGGEEEGQPKPKRSAKALNKERKFKDVLRHPDATMRGAAWVSQRFGTGKGADFDRLVALYRRIAALEAKAYTAAAWQAALAKTAGVAPGDELVTALRSETTKQASITNALVASLGKEVSADDAATFLKCCGAQAELWAKSRTGTLAKGPRKYAELVLGRLCEETGLPPAGQQGGLQEMLCDAAQTIQASTTRTRARIAELLVLFDSVASRKDTVPPAVAAALDAYRAALLAASGAEVSAVSRSAARGLRQVAAAWADAQTPEERKAATRVLVERSDEALGHMELFDVLAEHWGNGLSVDSVTEAIRVEQDVEHLAHMRLPCHVHPDPVHHPRYATFGPGYWFTSVTGEAGSGRRWGVRLRLFNGSEVEVYESALVSSRLFSDTKSTPGAPRAVRADRVGKAAARAADPAVRTGDLVEVMLKRMPSFQLLADRRQLERDGTCRNWTAKVSLRLEPAGPGLRFQAAHGVRRSEITEIPGLRVLGTNLGLRVACGWSVWETATLEEACAQLGRNPSADEEHLCAVSAKSGRIDYRRIGANDAPAPFARLIAEGLVPYDGDEDRPPTMLEQAVVGKILRRFGGTTVPGWSVWRLTEDTVKAVKKGLRAHADLARVISVLSNPESDAVLVANAMTAWWRGAALRPASSLGFLWAELARPIADTAEPSGEPAKWAKKLGAPAFSVPTTGQLGAVCQALRSDKAAIGVLSARWVRDDTLLRHALRLVELVVFGGTLTPELAVYADGGRSGSLARFVSRAPNPPVLAGVGGGRRPRRVGLFDDVRKLQVAYFTRRHPDGTQAELPEGFGWRLMEKRRKTVTDISKQVASAIVLQAVRNGAHVVVAEDLSSYKTSGANDPDTNRRLRLWTKGQVAMYLEQLCELHGLVYASTNPAWASWRDSRDGRLGYRVEPVAVAQIRAKGSEVRKRFDREVAEAKRIDGDASEHKKVVAAALVDLAERLPGILENAADGAYVVVPRRGGRWFAPADVRVGMLLGPDDVRHDGTVPLGLRQADSNAAGNTAVRWVRGRVSNR